MRALIVDPPKPGSVRIEEMPEPVPGEAEILVDGLAVGICATDREIIAGQHGWAPTGSDRLILGHESLGRVRSAPQDSGFSAGDLVVGVVRRPDPLPCIACAGGEFDMCRNGRYTERGIKESHGYASQAWCVETDYAVKLDPRLERVGTLMEPTSVVAKAWEQVERIGMRSRFSPKRVLVTGAGPIGLLAALLGMQRGLEVHVLDRVADGPKPDAVTALGAQYHSTNVREVTTRVKPDIIIEATGVSAIVAEAIAGAVPYSIVCLTGLSSAGQQISVDIGYVNREMVLENKVVFGSVNANLRHYAASAEALATADLDWLERLITRRVPLSHYAEAIQSRDDDIKVVLTLDED